MATLQILHTLIKLVALTFLSIFGAVTAHNESANQNNNNSSSFQNTGGTPFHSANFPNHKPCTKNGYVLDDADPRIYYLCSWNENAKSYSIETFICPDPLVFEIATKSCRTRDANSNGTEEYQCLKQNLENDASKICYEETIKTLEEEVDTFVDAAAWRGSPSRNFHLSVKDIHLSMRRHYAALIENTGKNIYPLIVATDSDTPELSGVGGAYKVYFRNGSMKRIVPVSSTFELHKSLSHMVLGVFAILAPYFRAGASINWQPAIKDFSQRVSEAMIALPNSDLPQKEKKHCRAMLGLTNDFSKKILKEGNITAERFHEFGNDMAPYIDKSMELAAKAHVQATIPALKQLKIEMGDMEWKKTYVIIPTVWPVSLYNIRLQMFRKVMDFKQIKQQVLITEGARNEDDARTTLGRVVADRALANLVFGGLKEESARDHLFSLSTRRDLLSSVEEGAIDRWCGGEDDWAVLRSKASSEASRCPMTKTYATMLRQSP